MTLTLKIALVRFGMIVSDETGATAIEYGLIATLIAVAAISAMSSANRAAAA